MNRVWSDRLDGTERWRSQQLDLKGVELENRGSLRSVQILSLRGRAAIQPLSSDFRGTHSLVETMCDTHGSSRLLRK